MTTDQHRPSSGAVFSILERTSEFGWAAQALFAAIALDLAVLAMTGSNLAHWPRRADALLNNLGLVAAGLAGFAVLNGMLLPFTSALLRQAVLLVSSLPNMGWIIGENRAQRREDGYVSERELRKHAYSTDDDLAREAYKEHVAASAQAWKDNNKLERGVFSALCGLIAGAFPALLGIHGTSLLAEIGARIGRPAEVVFTLGCAALAFVLWMCWFQAADYSYVYYPALTRRREDENAR